MPRCPASGLQSAQQELHTALAERCRCCKPLPMLCFNEPLARVASSEEGALAVADSFVAGADEAHLGELAECIAELEQAKLDNAALKEEVQACPPEHFVPAACMHEAACHPHLEVLQSEHPRSRPVLAAALLPVTEAEQDKKVLLSRNAVPSSALQEGREN